MDLIEAQLRLGRVRGLSAASLRRLLAATDGGKTARDLSWLLDHSALLRRMLSSVDSDRIDADRRWVERAGIALLDVTSAQYPSQLLPIPSAPRLLYCQGSIEALCSEQLAIVGSRRPTMPGEQVAREFAAHLARAGVTITSGLALGIDAAAHEGALKVEGRTVAVLGSGLDTIYPSTHRDLAARIAGSGALVSEFPPATAPRAFHFPRRNRIISGLSRGLLVVEAAIGSGSLTTADSARIQRRKLFAIPGSIRNPTSKGCHALIRGGATLVDDPSQILQELQFSTSKQVLMEFSERPRRVTAALPTLDKAYKILLDAAGFDTVSLDVLVERTGLPSQSVASMLLILELEGLVGRQADGRYVRL